MVGVPGRSRGCRPCRQRKKGCDLGNPSCERCRKAGIDCSYDQHRNFVRAEAAGSSSANSWQIQTIVRETSPSLLLAPQSLNNAALQEKYYKLAWDVFLPQGKPSLEYQTKYPLNSWIFIAQKLYGNHIALRKTMVAMTLSGLGRRDGKRDYINKGLKLYVEALGEIRQALSTVKGQNSAALIVAARSLAAYELLYGAEMQKRKEVSQVMTWHRHNLGETAMLSSKAPEIFSTGYAHRVFVDGRMHLMITACTTRKRTFLNEAVWRTKPWSVKPKSSRDFLLDVLIRIPSVLEDYDNLKGALAAPTPQGLTNQEAKAWHQSTCLHLLNDCKSVEADMLAWYSLHAPHEEYEILRARNYTKPDTDECVAVHILTMYWSGCVNLYTTIRQLQMLVDQPSEVAKSVATLVLTADSDPTTKAICEYPVPSSIEERLNNLHKHPGGDNESITPSHIRRAEAEWAVNEFMQATPSTASSSSSSSSCAPGSRSSSRQPSPAEERAAAVVAAASTVPYPPSDPKDPYTYCHYIAESMEAFFQPEAGTFGAFGAPFPMGSAFSFLVTATAEGKGMGSAVWNKLVSYFGKGEIGKALQVFLLGSLQQWQGVQTEEERWETRGDRES